MFEKALRVRESRGDDPEAIFIARWSVAMMWRELGRPEQALEAQLEDEDARWALERLRRGHVELQVVELHLTLSYFILEIYCQLPSTLVRRVVAMQCE